MTSSFTLGKGPVEVELPPSTNTLILPVAGPPGQDGAAAGHYEYEMSAPATTVTVNHPLGYDPVAVQVFVDSELCADYSVVYTIPNQQVRIAFDVSIKALIRLM